MQDVAQQLNISGCNSKKFMQQWIITCYWQRCRAELNMQFTFDSSQNKIQPDSTIYKGRKWWKKIPQHSKLSNDTVPWISSTIPSQKITGKKYKSKRVSVNAVIAHSYGCWSLKKFTLITSTWKMPKVTVDSLNRNDIWGQITYFLILTCFTSIM